MGGKGKKKTTVGYRYYWDVQAGIGRGPVDELVAITADDKTVFAGKSGEVTKSTSIYIDKPGLFGGDDVGGEGGIQGTFEIAMGDASQVPSATVLGLLTGLVPAFRGAVTTFYSGLISSFSASPKPWKYRVRRCVKGWDGSAWYSEKAAIWLKNDNATLDPELTTEQAANLRKIQAMNPAHILVECATNRDWGRGLDRDSELDLNSYKAAADTLYSEGFGLCFRYNRQDSLDTFIQQILDHVGAAQYCNTETGRLTLKLIRDDYAPEELPLFTYDNGIIEIQDDDSTSQDTAPNEITVTYRDPVTNTDGYVRVQNLGAITAVGLISNSTDYPAIPTNSLAARVAQRDLEMGSSGLARLVIRLDRRAAALAPASVFRITAADRGIENLVLRVGKIQEEDDGSLKVTAVQDVFALPATAYNCGETPSQWIPPDMSVKPVTDWALFELPHIVLASVAPTAELNALASDACFIGVVASAPNSAQINYQLLTNAGSGWQDGGAGDWTPAVKLTADTGLLDKVLHVKFSAVPAIGAGLLIDNEIVRVDAVDYAAGTITVGRACADTIPAAHKVDAYCWIYENSIESDDTEYLTGETVQAKLLSTTSVKIYSPNDAGSKSVKMQARQARPYLPGNIRLNDEPYPLIAASASQYVLSWAHRDRLLQADRLVDCMQGDIGPEQGVRYRITLKNQDTDNIVWMIDTSENDIDIPYVTGQGSGHILTLCAIRENIYSSMSWLISLPAGNYIPSEE
ncbi:phage tail protein [Salmonella enterica]